jgi:DNA end-binding protein Ku
VTAPEEPDDTKVVDLMEALRRSLGESDKPPAKKAPAGKSAHKSSAKKRA